MTAMKGFLTATAQDAHNGLQTWRVLASATTIAFLVAALNVVATR
jgi:hypothetical protein